MAKHDVTVELFYSGVWNDHTATDEVYTGEATNGRDVTITHGGREQSGGLTPATAALTFRSWRFNPDNVTGDLYGLIGRNTPIRITVDGDVRFVGEVSSWTPQQTLGGDVQVPDRWVEVDAGGDLRRLEAGTDPLPSSLKTFYVDNAAVPVAYWPLDAGQLSGTALPVYGAYSFSQSTNAVSELTAGEVAPWLESGVGMSKGLNVAGAVDMAQEPSQWAVDIMLRASDDARDFSLEMIGNGKDSSGDRIDWWLGFDISAELFQVTRLLIDPSGTSGAAVGSGTFAIGDDQPHHIRFTVADDGADVDWAAYVDGVAISSGTETSQEMQGLGKIRIYSPSSSGTEAALFSHIAAWEGAPPALADTVEAAFGHAGETAGDRFVRLSGESGITDTVAGTAAETIPMGPQFPGTLASQYEEIAASDDGLIFDTVAAAGVSYKTGRDRYNQDATLTLDYAAYEVAPPLKPVLDDKAIRNDVTVSRRAGGTARAVDEDSVDDVGRYTSRPEVNVFSDLVLDASAGWAVHTGTAAGTRFEKVTADLDACPNLLDDVVATDVGDRITITNLPAELTPDTASLIVNGWREIAGPDRRRVTFNCTTEAALHIAELEHDDYATVGALFTTLSGNHTDTDTTLAIAPGGDGLWVYEADFDIVIGGERMTVTAQSAGAGTFPNQSQILTVVRSVNGVVKAQANGATIQLFNRAYIGL